MPPSVSDVVIGSAAVVLACIGGAYAVWAAGRGRRLWLVCAAGCLALVAGVVGQRTFPTEDAVGRLGRDAASRQVPGPWEAGVGVPVVGLHVTPVALVGLLLSIAGVSLVLFLEPAPTAVAEPRRAGTLEEDDAV